VRLTVHADLEHFAVQSNILIDGDRSIKIADFGLSLVGDVTDERFKTTKSGSGSEGWKAPERVENSSSRREAPADVFAFACVCYMASYVTTDTAYELILFPS
jgi:serine/threonine protein kinase